MRRLAWATVPIAACLALASCESKNSPKQVGGARQDSVPTKFELVDPINWKQVRFEATAPSEVDPGKPIEVEFVLVNDSSARLLLVPGQGVQMLSVSVSKDAEECALTEVGKSTFYSDRPLSTPRESVDPNGSRRWKVDILPCFDLQPGKYVLSAKIALLAVDPIRQGVESTKIAALPVEFTIR